MTTHHALLSQGASSLSTLLIGVVVARNSTLVQFGTFGISFLGYQLALEFVRSSGPEILLANPRLSYRHSRAAEQLLATVLGIVGLAFALLISSMRPYLLPLSLAFPILQAIDSIRYRVASIGQYARALRSDLTWLVWSIGLFVMSFFAEIGPTLSIVGWTCGAICGLVVSDVQVVYRFSLKECSQWLREQWSTIQPLLLANVSGRLAMYLGLLISAQMLLPEYVGSFRGAQIVLAPITVSLSGLRFVMIPRMAAANRLRIPGESGRQWYIWTANSVVLASILGIAAMGVPRSVGEILLGSTWDSARAVLPLVAGGFVAQAIASASRCALAAAGSYKSLARSQIRSSALTVLIFFLCSLGLSSLGADAVAIAFTSAGVVNAIAVSAPLFFHGNDRLLRRAIDSRRSPILRTLVVGAVVVCASLGIVAAPTPLIYLLSGLAVLAVIVRAHAARGSFLLLSGPAVAAVPVFVGLSALALGVDGLKKTRLHIFLRGMDDELILSGALIQVLAGVCIVAGSLAGHQLFSNGSTNGLTDSRDRVASVQKDRWTAAAAFGGFMLTTLVIAGYGVDQLLHRNTYIDPSGPPLLRHVANNFTIPAQLLLCYSGFASKRVLERLLSIGAGLALTMTTFAMGSRELALIPIVMVLGFLSTSEDLRRKRWMALPAVFAFVWLLSLPIGLRQLETHGLQPYATAVLSGEVGEARFALDSSLASTAIATPSAAAVRDREIPVGTITRALDPLPGSSGWHDLATNLRFAKFDGGGAFPYPAIGTLAAIGWVQFVLVLFGVGLAVAWCQREVMRIFSANPPVGNLGILGLALVVGLLLTQYSLRDPIRVIEMSVTVLLAARLVRATLTRPVERAGVSTSSYDPVSFAN